MWVYVSVMWVYECVSVCIRGSDCVTECICERANMCMTLWCRIMWMCAHEWVSVIPCGMGLGIHGSLCERWTCPEKGWYVQCCNGAYRSAGTQDMTKYTLSEWTAASPSCAENRIWSVSICWGTAFFSAFVLLDKNGEQESVFLLDVSKWT